MHAAQVQSLVPHKPGMVVNGRDPSIGREVEAEALEGLCLAFYIMNLKLLWPT